jgi:hypothetical protein
MKQTKWESFIEACTNTLIAFFITAIFLPLVNYLCNVHMNPTQMGLHVLLMTIISIFRNFFIRRFFNGNITRTILNKIRLTKNPKFIIVDGKSFIREVDNPNYYNLNGRSYYERIHISNFPSDVTKLYGDKER